MRLPFTFVCCLSLLFGACKSRTEQAPTPVRTASHAQPTSQLKVPEEFTDVMDYARAQQLHERPLGEIMQAVGERFTGKPYMAGLLDEPAEEVLVCRLDGFDCVTFVETALAMARGIAEQDYSYETFQRNVTDTRYRGAEMDGYCSRLHYWSEWIIDNEVRGNVENITAELGGTRLDKEINFMTTHRDLYPRFATNDEVFECVQQMEERIGNVELYYIPKDRIRAAYDQLQAGDIIATATNITGLDVSHTGLVYDPGDGEKGLLHASTSGGVKVSPDLQDYVQNNNKLIGIVVVRPISL
jgi:hypothetical protein